MGMTEQEAIKFLKIHKPSEKHGDLSDLGYNFKDAYDMAIEALEKQMPKKPIINGSLACKCPTCGSIEIEIVYENGSEVMCKNCPDCGQKLDWGNEDAESDCNN